MDITAQQEPEAEQETPKVPDPMTTVGVRMKKDLVARIDACSKRELRCRSDLTRIIFTMAFENYEKNQTPVNDLMLAHNK